MKFSAFLVFCGCFGVGAELCLPTGIPEEERLHILNVSNQLSPVRFAPFAWSFSAAASEIARILISEVLGYHAVVKHDPLLWDTVAGIRTLAGCYSLDCSVKDTRPDVLMDTWLTPAALFWEQFQSENPNVAEDLGSMGYSGLDGLYLKGSVRDRAASDGVFLEYYKSYNLLIHEPYKYFNSLYDLPEDQLLMCNDTKSGSILEPLDSAKMKNYFDQTGDAEGVVVENGQYRGNCQLPHWWIAPACRNDYTKCIPLLQTGQGAMGFFMQWATVHGLPLALTHTSSLFTAEFAAMVRSMDLLFYHFEPDDLFKDLDISRIILPSHSPNAWLKGDYSTASDEQYIGKLAAQHLRISAPRVRKFLQNFRLESAVPLLAYPFGVYDVGAVFAPAACEWIRSNEDIWRAWIPVATDCTLGFGLADAQGASVASLDTAVDCHVCPAGSFSELFTDNSSRATYRCQLCEAGQHQSRFGQSGCVACAPGTYAKEAGQALCTPCGRGTFMNSSGAKECLPCGDDVWTTSKLEAGGSGGGEKWIEVEGATSESDCHCVEGRHAVSSSASTTCEVCVDGSSCPGSGVLALLPGYYSTQSDPGAVLECFGNSLRCPGGPPGTCAAGRDPTSAACSLCLPGLQERDAECAPCTGEDYVSLLTLTMLVLLGTAILHIVLALLDRSASSYRGALLGSALCANQLITCAQLFSVMAQVQSIGWEEPFLSFLRFFEVLSLQPLLDSVKTISCVTRLSTEVSFLIRTLLVPMFFAVGPLLAQLAMRMARLSPKTSSLMKTFGFLCLLFYISLCSSFVEPFRCNVHPNGALTMQSSHEVFCDFTGSHFNLCWMSGLICLLPISFLVMCTWLLLVVLPRRVKAANALFVRACSFLIMRFKPGYELFTVAFLVRNVLFVLTPLLRSSTSLFVMGNLLAMTLVAVSYYKPWRSDLATKVDLLVSSMLLAVLQMGSLNVKDAQTQFLMVLCTVCGALIVFALILGAGFALVQHIGSKLRKKYDFFLSHQRSACAAYARMMGMELKRSGFSVFIDTDNLTDLSRLFTYVSNDTNTLVLLASPRVLTRKWCMGELVVARLAGVETVLLSFPGFRTPEEAFIAHYASIVPDVKEFSVYGIGMSEVQETLRWLGSAESFQVAPEFSTENLAAVLGELTKQPAKQIKEDGGNSTDYVILPDPDNMEAVVTAHILGRFLVSIAPERGLSPRVLGREEQVSRTDTRIVLLCTHFCFQSVHMARWVLQARVVPDCQLLPVVADDRFNLPRRHGGSVSPGTHVPGIDDTVYMQVIKAIFVEVAMPFIPSQSSEVDLGIRSRQVALRLYGELKPLSTKLLMVAKMPDEDANDEADRFSFDSSNASLRLLNQVPDKNEQIEQHLQNILADIKSETVTQAF